MQEMESRAARRERDMDEQVQMSSISSGSGFVGVREWLDGCLILMGMLSWTVSRFVPVEFCWNSMAEACPHFA